MKIISIKCYLGTYHTGLGSSLHSNLAVWIDLEASIKNTVRDLIAELVWMAFSD